MPNPFFVDDSQQLPGGSTGDPTMDQLGIGRATPYPKDNPDQPGTVKRIFSGFLQGMSDALKHEAGLPTSYEEELSKKQLALQEGNQRIAMMNAQSLQGQREATEEKLRTGLPTPATEDDAKRFGVKVGDPITPADRVKFLLQQVTEKGKTDRLNDDQDFKAKEAEKGRAFKSLLFEQSERGKNARAAAVRAGILRPLVDSSGKITGMFNNRTGEMTPVDGGDFRTSGLAGTELNRRGMLAGMIEDVDLLDTLAQSNKDVLGPVSGRLEALQQATMGSSEDKVQMFRISANLKDQLLRARSGAQINEQEFKRLSALVPDPNNPPETFFARLNDFRRDITRLGGLTAAPKTKGGKKDPLGIL